MQCAYDENTGSTGAYRYGYKSISKIVISNAPIDTDWNRWSMLHDGKDYRLYFMSKIAMTYYINLHIMVQHMTMVLTQWLK